MTARTTGTLVVTAVTLALFSTARPAVAGPPLLCHPFDIGSAPSLPWDGRASWFDGKDGYDLRKLVAETESLLTAQTPVLVRMETVRRAAIYASADAAVAGRLLQALSARVHAEQADAERALAYLDLAYLVGAYDQLGALSRRSSEFAGRERYLRPMVARLDAYALVRKSLVLRPGDASVEFAAALVAADKDRAAYSEHSRRARAGSATDVLLARNLARMGS